MDGADSFIRFYCDNCGHKSIVSESYAGKKIRCPECYNIIFIPAPESTGETKTSSKYSDYDASLLDIHEQNVIKHQQIREYIAFEQAEELEQELKEEPPKGTESAVKRKFPAFIDIFFYPFSKPGLKNLLIFVGVPLLINVLGTILPIQLSCLFALVTIVVNIVIFFFVYWYFTECIRDSADGWVRAPEGFGATPGFMGMFWQTVNVFGCFAIFFGPFVFYMLFARKVDIIFWLLLVYAVFLFPIGLLAVIMFDSALGLNPIRLIRSIYSTFLPYLGIVLLFVTPLVLIGIIRPETQKSLLWDSVLRFIIIYMILVGAHLLGRFYWRHQDKLNWDV